MAIDKGTTCEPSNRSQKNLKVTNKMKCNETEQNYNNNNSDITCGFEPYSLFL